MEDTAISTDASDILPGAGLLPDDTPETVVAGLPTTLIVGALEAQLATGKTGFTSTDYLAPILDSAAVLRQRYEGRPEVVASLDSSLRSILSRVVGRIQDEWDVDLTQVGLDPSSGSYYDDVLELYRFMVVDRLALGRELLAQVVVSARKRFAESYRKVVEKKNQTVAEARRVFVSFDDVVVWVSIPQIIEDLRGEGNWGFNFAESAQMLGATPGSLVSRISSVWNNDDFAERYCQPALVDENASVTSMNLQDRWMNDAPKKTDNQTETAE
jgi:hypothetical protein